jgi:RNA-directed DNA polymerase
MDTTRQNHRQLMLAFEETTTSEARAPLGEGAEVPMAGSERKSPASSNDALMEAICAPENMLEAHRRVTSNKGAAGVDGMSVDDLGPYLREHWPEVRGRLLAGTYVPQPVRRKSIPKPGGGERKLGIPTVLDRLIQQAILQVISPTWEATFSESSFGFRPGRSAHQAVARARELVCEGHDWVVDLDLEKFFDRVNHDRLMAALAKRTSDRRLLKLIRAFLNAGVMENGPLEATAEGTPQGGPLSPLLSNIVLDELDKELERRGHAFVRYADDCNIYVRSERAGERVMESISDFITRRLRLKVNQQKSAVARPSKRKFLGFSLSKHKGEVQVRLAPATLKRFRERVRQLTQQRRGISAAQMVGDLTIYLRGWIGYFHRCETPSELEKLDGWIRRRLRAVAWHQWKTPWTRRRRLMHFGLNEAKAKSATWNRGPTRASGLQAMNIALPNALWRRLGLLSLMDAWKARTT